MKNILKISLLSAVLGVSSLVTANSIRADDSVQTVSVDVSLTFTEPVMNKDCTIVNGFCGSGEVIPFSHATETIEFGAACDGACDLRTIYLPEGSIVIEEVFSLVWCQGDCESHEGNFPAFNGTLTDIVIGGTGIFEGASGQLSGSVRGGGKTSQIKLSGTIILSLEQ